jgi:pyridoxal phosphate enzyme (YggS family)
MMSEIAQNLENTLSAIRQSAENAGRQPDSVKLLAVSKTKSVDLIREAFDHGQMDFGENRVQELVDKQPELPQLRWHMIGHLQRNKVRQIAGFIHLIHSVDSARLLGEISKQALKHDRVIDCLIQMNISEEEAKSGLDEKGVAEILNRMDDFPNVRVLGLMGMAELTDDAVVIRSEFRRLKNAFESFKGISHPRVQMQELSMGMSGDYDIAIAEGATMVRIGTAVFGARPCQFDPPA